MPRVAADHQLKFGAGGHLRCCVAHRWPSLWAVVAALLVMVEGGGFSTVMAACVPSVCSFVSGDGLKLDLHRPEEIDVQLGQSMSASGASPEAPEVVLQTPQLQVVLHKNAVVSASLPLPVAADDELIAPDQVSDEDARDVPDQMPSKKFWPSTAGVPGYPKAGPGRPKGSGLHVRDSLEEIALVIFCRDLRTLFSAGEPSDVISATELSALAALRTRHAQCSDKKLAERAFSLVPLAGVGLIAKFGRDEIREEDGPEQAVVIELTALYNDELLCACSSPEQCFLTGCTFAEPVKSAWRKVSEACAVAPAALLRSMYERMGEPLAEGDARMCGDMLCAVRGSGGNWPWMLVRKSRAAFWTCMSCVEQGLLCSHAAAARAAYSLFLDNQEDVSDDEEEPETPAAIRRQLALKYQRSHRPRFAVPSLVAFATEQKLRTCALTDTPFDLKAPEFCPVPGCPRAYKLARRSGIVRGAVEFEEGSAPCDVQWWLCQRCNVKVMDDGLEHGIIFGSIETGYTEPFLFNVAAGLVANGSCVSATVDLRENVLQLSGSERLPLKANAVRTLPTFRQALMLYLELVVEGFPASIFRCSSCVQPSGSYKSISFDGLYMGIRAKHRRELKRIRLRLGLVPGAVAVASLVKDGVIVIALARVLRQATADSNGKGDHPRATSLRAAIGAIYAIAMLHPEALERKDKDASDSADQQWNPVADGKVDNALVVFARDILLGKDVAVQLGRSVVNAPAKVREKLPACTVATLAQFVRAADKDLAESSTAQRPDARLAAALDEPALCDTGGARGDGVQAQSRVRLHPRIPCTVNGAAKIIEFVRALCAEPVLVWCANGDWGAIEALVHVLDGANWTEDALQRVLKDRRVSEQRVLRGAIACLAPALLSSSDIRSSLRKVLLAVRRSFRQYLRYVKDESDPANGAENLLTRSQVAGPDFTRALTPAEFDSLWMAPRISLSELARVYGAKLVASLRDYHQSGVFCPALPLLRPGIFFVDGGRLTEEDSLCEKDFGSAAGWTAGTFGVFCCCSHPMCIAVIMMDGHEGPRMPLDFIISRLPALPTNVIYDFACGYVKSAICRSPRVAVFVKAVVDVFHFRKGHKTCSAASSPNAYESLRGTNTSSAEQRNAATKRLKPFIRLLNQRNFLTFSAYQQGVCNIAALYRKDRDAAQPGARVLSIGWPLWYRESLDSNKRSKTG